MSDPYTIEDARYAKGKKVVRVHDGHDGLKGRSAYLIGALGGRYVNRSRGYVMSPAAVDKLETLYTAGFEAEMQLYPDTPPSLYHRERGLEGLTVAQALREARA